MNEESALFIQKTPDCPYPKMEDRKYEYEPYKDHFDEDENRYYCTVLGGYCIDIVYYNPINNSLIDGYPCHERSCAKQVFRLKGCAASDDFIIETYKQRKMIQNNQILGKPGEPVDESRLPKRESTCMGEYGPEKKRKDGTFFMQRDWGMAGIAHIPTKASCEPVCAGPEYPEEKHRCNKDHNCKSNWDGALTSAAPWISRTVSTRCRRGKRRS